jgi:hypothetical protein
MFGSRLFILVVYLSENEAKDMEVRLKACEILKDYIDGKALPKGTWSTPAGELASRMLHECLLAFASIFVCAAKHAKTEQNCSALHAAMAGIPLDIQVAIASRARLFKEQGVGQQNAEADHAQDGAPQQNIRALSRVPCGVPEQ